MMMMKELKQERATENEPVSTARTIRSYYRQIENRINEGKDEISIVDSDKFMDIMNEVENMHQHVNNPREQVADAETLLGLTRHLAASVKSHTAGGVTPAEFVSCLIKDFGLQNSMTQSTKKPQNISWRNIGFLVTPVFMRAPRFRTMIGPMGNKLKTRKVRATRSRTLKSNARTKEVEKAAELVSDTDRNILVMFELLKKKKTARVENLMLNRNSFAQTVENLFALSFLVKDGRVRINVDETGSQVVVPSNGPSAKDIASGAVRNHQFIFRLDFNDWKLMMTLVPEGEEIMPQREDFDNVITEKCDQDFSWKTEKCDQDFSPSPVERFSKNNACTIVGSFGTIKNWSCKRKRSAK